MAGEIQYTESKVLLVEGADDERFFSGLLGMLGIRKGNELPRSKLRGIKITVAVAHGVADILFPVLADEHSVESFPHLHVAQ